MAGPSLLEDLKLLIRTRHVIVTIQTLEEEFAIRLVREAGRDLNRVVVEWSISDGLRRVGPDGFVEEQNPLLSLGQALRLIRDDQADTIYMLKDALRHLDDPANERLLRDLSNRPGCPAKTVFLIDAAGKLPAALAPLAAPYEVALPDDREIRQVVRDTARQLTRRPCVQLTRQEEARFLSNLRGLTRLEVAQVVAQAILTNGQIDEHDVDLPIEVKQRRLRQTGVLDYIPPPEVAPSIGGMDNLRRWLAKRADAWTSEARAFGLDWPKGILMLGVQGCGKSLMARYVAAQWKTPLLRLDVAALYDKYIGETERHLRTAFASAAAMAPCVLWIDEIEKAFASAGAGVDAARTDGGLSQRMFGMLLTWMQDHREPVFIVATANDVSSMPPELMRKGRFDEVFFVDLPGPSARQGIFEIHLRKRRRRPEDFDLAALADGAEGFSGAEIEQAVVSAMYSAFAEKRELTTADLHTELRATRPLSVLMADRVSQLRAWAHQRCVPAD